MARPAHFSKLSLHCSPATLGVAAAASLPLPLSSTSTMRGYCTRILNVNFRRSTMASLAMAWPDRMDHMSESSRWPMISTMRSSSTSLRVNGVCFTVTRNNIREARKTVCGKGDRYSRHPVRLVTDMNAGADGPRAGRRRRHPPGYQASYLGRRR